MTANWSCPDAELILTVEQSKDRDLWLATRRMGIGGSDMATLMGEGKWSTPFEVWMDKTGRSPEDEQSLQMEFGNLWEEGVAQKFCQETGLTVQRRGLMRSKKNPIIQASIDRLSDDGGVVECKAVNQFTKIGDDDEPRHGLPAHWWWQGVDYIWTTGRTHCWFAAAIGNTKFVIRRIDESEDEVQDAFTRIEDEVPDWWLRYVVGGEMPEMGAPPKMDEIAADKKVETVIPGLLFEKARRLREVRQIARDVKAEGDALRAELKAEAGNAEFITANGIPVIRIGDRLGNMQFKKARFTADHPEIDINEYFERNKPSKLVYLMGDDDDE